MERDPQGPSDAADAPTEAAAGQGEAGGPPGRRPSATLLAEIAVIGVVIALIAGYVWVLPAVNGTGGPSVAPSASAPAVAVGSGSPEPVASAESSVAGSAAPSGPTPHPTSTTVPGGAIGPNGGVVVLGNNGSLSVIDGASSRETLLATADEGLFLFPAWSPDGTRIAAIRNGPSDTEIEVFDAIHAEAGEPVAPKVLLKSSEIGPFYLSWSPDGRQISYLANEPNGLALRIVPADGSAPVDGSAPNARIKTGNPLYYDWIATDRVLAHVGTGADAFLGELATDGSASAPAIDKPGDFRSATVSGDGKLFGYIRAGSGAASDVVLATRDGSRERTMPVFGTAAVSFDPAGSIVASIGPSEPQPVQYGFPFGPLRLLDAAGKSRTLLDGQVVAFWWSPDGKTIAAMRVQRVVGAGGSPSPSAAAPSPEPSPSTAASALPSPGDSSAASPGPSPSQPPTEVRLFFVDVASGKIESQPVVAPGSLFVNQFLVYFDQYAVSHQLWAPDSSSMLLPVADDAGGTSIELLPRRGGTPRTFEGAMAFWSP